MAVEKKEKHQTLKELQPLFDEAKEKGLWFYSFYQNLWFSPKDLRRLHRKGRYIWGRDNWELRDPQERLAELQGKKMDIEKQIIELKAKI